MKKFSKVYEGYKDELLRNKLDNNLELHLSIEKWKEGNWYIKENFDKNWEEDWEEEEKDFSLKCTKKTIFHVDYGDFNKLINDYYNPPRKRYNFVVDMESFNDVSHELSATKNNISNDDIEDIESFKKNGKHNWLANTLLNDLCDKGIIEEGDYLISVSW